MVNAFGPITMNVHQQISILKYFLMIFNGIFLILGIVILGCGLWILFDTNSFLTTLTSTTNGTLSALGIIGYTFLGIGFFTVLVCFFGCLGTYKEVKCLLIMYMACLVLIFLVQILLLLSVFFTKSDIANLLDTEINKIIINSGNVSATDSDEVEWKLFDLVQKSSECCGNNNFTDWKRNKYIESSSLNDTVVLPCSCIKSSKSDDMLFCKISPDSDNYYKKGCGAKIEEWFSTNILSILGIEIGLAAIEIFQFTFALVLYKQVIRIGTL
ncbi:tetraspanin-19-like isoform X1 [Erpetoichthys calabaricus]|uniref:tetraspanin-19-like isoform X1 n=1 Tax=Erpetoichthys calabaricus TaxID=27687 RepID=UPI002234A1E2|nr:tetraspanin-19-like isoform X1 [Erpetoichthys calabaricus]XP_051775463.1 tetraspanin-19-like isoform X1 [Erpetoichthys calabaricus]